MELPKLQVSPTEGHWEYPPYLTGTLPGVALAGFWRLQAFIIKWNGMTGALPEVGLAKKQLVLLDVSLNRFQGSLPHESL
eukprot:255623-Amphidinium_carterae.1